MASELKTKALAYLKKKLWTRISHKDSIGMVTIKHEIGEISYETGTTIRWYPEIRIYKDMAMIKVNGILVDNNGKETESKVSPAYVKLTKGELLKILDVMDGCYWESKQMENAKRFGINKYKHKG